MWTEFGWDNRVNMATSITYVHAYTASVETHSDSLLLYLTAVDLPSDLRQYLKHNMSLMDMGCLPPRAPYPATVTSSLRTYTRVRLW